MNTHVIEHEYTFQPSGVTVAVYRWVKQLYPGSGEEPADFATTKTEMYCNHKPVNPDKHWKLKNYVLEHGR
jgi:hypothetical protein